MIDKLIRDNVTALQDVAAWKAAAFLEQKHRSALRVAVKSLGAI